MSSAAVSRPSVWELTGVLGMPQILPSSRGNEPLKSSKHCSGRLLASTMITVANGFEIASSAAVTVCRSFRWTVLSNLRRTDPMRLGSAQMIPQCALPPRSFSTDRACLLAPTVSVASVGGRICAQSLPAGHIPWAKRQRSRHLRVRRFKKSALHGGAPCSFGERYDTL
jgi:hypothetical protein